MNNVISMSLWGKEEIHRFGALENCKLWKIIYPEWKLRFYIDDTIEQSFARELNSHGAEVYKVTNVKGSFHGMFWRFWVNDDKTVNKYIIRDCDSRLNYRELSAVNEWIFQNKDFHIMRDYPTHTFPIMGGMWGGTAGKFNITKLINDWGIYDRYCIDQDFLSLVIYPMIKNNSTVHCTYIEKKPFPPHQKNLYNSTFVGQIFDEKNNPVDK